MPLILSLVLHHIHMYIPGSVYILHYETKQKTFSLLLSVNSSIMCLNLQSMLF